VSVRVVLIETTHPGNIGAVARAMGNMGLERLELVRPVDFLNEQAFARSAGNERILQNASVHQTLDEAVSDCRMIIGTSARVRTVRWPSQSPEESMHAVASASREGVEVALLFGPERTGLSNQHVDRCNVLVRIPVDESSPSINLAGAVLIMLYELRKALMCGEVQPAKADVPAGSARHATSAEMTGFFGHLEQVVRQTGFVEDGPRESLLRKIRRIFVRSEMTDEEVNIMRGVFTAILNRRPTAVSRPGGENSCG